MISISSKPAETPQHTNTNTESETKHAAARFKVRKVQPVFSVIGRTKQEIENEMARDKPPPTNEQKEITRPIAGSRQERTRRNAPHKNPRIGNELSFNEITPG